MQWFVNNEGNFIHEVEDGSPIIELLYAFLISKDLKNAEIRYQDEDGKMITLATKGIPGKYTKIKNTDDIFNAIETSPFVATATYGGLPIYISYDLEMLKKDEVFLVVDFKDAGNKKWDGLLKKMILERLVLKAEEIV